MPHSLSLDSLQRRIRGVLLSGHGREKCVEALHGWSVLKTAAIRHG